MSPDSGGTPLFFLPNWGCTDGRAAHDPFMIQRPANETLRLRLRGLRGLEQTQVQASVAEAPLNLRPSPTLPAPSRPVPLPKGWQKAWRGGGSCTVQGGWGSGMRDKALGSGHHSPMTVPSASFLLANLDLPTQSAVPSGVGLGRECGCTEGASGRRCPRELVNSVWKEDWSASMPATQKQVLVPPAVGRTHPERSPNAGTKAPSLRPGWG